MALAEAELEAGVGTLQEGGADDPVLQSLRERDAALRRKESQVIAARAAAQVEKVRSSSPPTLLPTPVTTRLLLHVCYSPRHINARYQSLLDCVY